jgi:hypothetical protein
MAIIFTWRVSPVVRRSSPKAKIVGSIPIRVVDPILRVNILVFLLLWIIQKLLLDLIFTFYH